MGLYTKVWGHCVTQAPLSLKFIQACKKGETKVKGEKKKYTELNHIAALGVVVGGFFCVKDGFDCSEECDTELSTIHFGYLDFH